MNAPAPFPLTEIEGARIEADALVGAFDDHRRTMDTGSVQDRLTERMLHAEATKAVRLVEQLEAFTVHADAAIDLTGGQR